MGQGPPTALRDHVWQFLHSLEGATEEGLAQLDVLIGRLQRVRAMMAAALTADREFREHRGVPPPAETPQPQHDELTGPPKVLAKRGDMVNLVREALAGGRLTFRDLVARMPAGTPPGRLSGALHYHNDLFRLVGGRGGWWELVAAGGNGHAADGGKTTPAAVDPPPPGCNGCEPGVTKL